MLNFWYKKKILMDLVNFNTFKVILQKKWKKFPFLFFANQHFFITLQSEYGLTEEQVAGEFYINFISPCLGLIWNTREGNLPGAKTFSPNHEKSLHFFGEFNKTFSSPISVSINQMWMLKTCGCRGKKSVSMLISYKSCSAFISRKLL